jgi:hypothetical protein
VSRFLAYLTRVRAHHWPVALVLAGAVVGSGASAATGVVGATSGCAPRSSSYSSQILGTPGLTAYWRLGEASGTIACDSAGSNNGSYQSGTVLARPGALAGDPTPRSGSTALAAGCRFPTIRP